MNMSCGLAALMVMVPAAAMAIYSMSADLPGILLAILLILGAGHSVWWAHRARKKNGKQGS